MTNNFVKIYFYKIHPQLTLFSADYIFWEGYMFANTLAVMMPQGFVQKKCKQDWV